MDELTWYMKSSSLVFALAVLAGTLGCEPTPYQRDGARATGGYSDRRLSEDTFHVKFVGTFTTPEETLREYLYRRSAELTLRHGFQYFAVLRDSRPVTEYQTKYRSRSDEAAGVDGLDVEFPAWGTLHMTIQCFEDRPETAGENLIDAKAYLQKPSAVKDN